MRAAMHVYRQADVLILGATVAAAGAIASLKQRGMSVCILERHQVCAAEFADALYTEGDTTAYLPQTEAGADFREELVRRQILTERGISLPAVAPVICAQLAGSGVSLLAPVTVTDIADEGNEYRVTIVSMGISYSLRCRAILDTTASLESGLWTGVLRPSVSRCIGANVIGDIPGALPGGRRGECFIRESVSDGDYDTAREALIRRAAEAGARVVITPMTPAEVPNTCGAEIAPGYIHCPSSAQKTVIAAYDAGVRAGMIITPTQVMACTPLHEQDGGVYDVIVAGGGTAGAIAALAAAREGGRVLLLEDGICLGGQGTAGGVLGYYFGVPGGLFEEADELGRSIQRKSGIVPMGHAGDTAKRMALGRLLRAAGVEIRYEATALSVVREGNRITGVRYRTSEGLYRAMASYVIDATADGALLISAGAEMMGGRSLDGKYQPFSNVIALYEETTDRARYTYTDNGIVSPYDPAALGTAIAESGCSIHHLLASYAGATRYLGCASRIGLREGGRIVGEESVTLPDLLAGRITDQPLFWGYSNLDNHGKDNALEDSLCRRFNTVASMWGYNFTIPIPAGALIPRGLSGILAAGRCIAVDHTVASAVRMKYDMQKSGEAAGVLAMRAIQRCMDAREVPYEDIRARLLDSGCLQAETVPAVVHLTQERVPTTMSEGTFWRSDAAWLKTQLAGDRPGYAIWAAAHHGQALREELVQWIHAGEQPLSAHAALALGLAGCEGVAYQEAIPTLLHMAQDRSGAVPHSGRRYNYPYAVSAATLLELLGVEAGIDAVLPYVADVDYAAAIPYEKCELTEDQGDVIFQFVLQGLRVLSGLGAQLPHRRAEIDTAVRARIYAPEFHLSITGKGKDTVRLDYTDTVRSLWTEWTENWQ